MRYLMKCGHVTGATYLNDDKPVCVICCGIKPGYDRIECVAEGSIGLDDRQAKCWQCGKLINSNWDLYSFEYKPKEEYDSCYCGCRGFS
jgi:hypothetical protein